jgi:hypothetical protein
VAVLWLALHGAHAAMPLTNDWFASHPPAEAAPAELVPRSLAVCVFGMPGVSSGKAMRRGVDGVEDMVAAAVARRCADNHVRFIIAPAAARSMTVRVFVHAWTLPNSSVALAIDTSYGSYLGASLYEPATAVDKMSSMARSIVLALLLARTASGRAGRPFDLVLAMRHDTYWLVPPCLRLDPRFLTIATWCQSRQIRQSRWARGRCGTLDIITLYGVHDFWFAGGQVLLEWVFGSLEERLARGEKIGAVPTSAHFVIQAQLDHLLLTQRGLVRSHPGVSSFAHFTLFRWHEFAATKQTLPPASSAGGAQTCDGREVCLSSMRRSKRLGRRDIGPW